jgi:parvulin-like peptidyl-prolyl isomerase
MVALCGAHVPAQDKVPPQTANAGWDRVAATVVGADIYVAQVHQYVRRVLGDRTVDAATRQRVQAEALEQLVKQQIVLDVLAKRGEACTPRQLDLAIARFQDELSRQEQSLEAYCRTRGIPLSAFERAMRWQLSWHSYLEKSLTDENLRQYFEDHRPDFDGTMVRVAQILLACPDDPAPRTKAEQQARAIREDILAGKLSFGAAARQYSHAPSARDGGGLEWISRHAPMPEFFARAAFVLPVGGISPPIVSPLGVHLIQCVEIKPGQKEWQDVRDALSAAFAQHLFDWNVAQAGPPSDLKFTGAVPYFQPGTRVIVVPEQNVGPESERTGK